jgi:hypothetical protein
MKKITGTLIFLLVLSYTSFAQEMSLGKDYYAAPERTGSTLFLGFGTGINNYLGIIGPSLEFQIAPKFTIFGGAGWGSWGNKVSAGIRYYGNFPGNWAVGLGISHSGGLEKIEFNMLPEYVVGQSENVLVPFKLKGANTLNLSANRYWLMGKARKSRFNIEFGYAVPLAENQYEVKDGYQLTSDGRYFMNIMQPGGINIGAGFSFGLN